MHETLLEILASRNVDEDTSSKAPSLELNIWEAEVPNEPDEEFMEADGLFKLDTAPVKTAFKRQLPKYEKVCKFTHTYRYIIPQTVSHQL